MKTQRSNAIYPHPFSRGYWWDALKEFTNLRILIFAALMIALRLVMKTYLAIPLAPGLKINTAFFANALGAMVFGPVMASVCAAITDVLGWMMNPEGPYFFPFIFTEIAGSLIFALFLYRAKITPLRVMLSRFFICFFVNVVLQTPIMLLYYQIYMGGKVYALTIPGILKNLFMFPIESVILTLFLAAVLPVTDRLKLTHGNRNAKEVLHFSGKQIATLTVLVIVGAGSVLGYLNYHYETTSLSASYTSEERSEKNREMLAYVLENEEGCQKDTTLTIVEYAGKKLFGKETTYTVAVYAMDATTDKEKAWGYSKSKAAKDQTLTRLGTVTVVLTNKNGKVSSYTFTPENTPDTLNTPEK